MKTIRLIFILLIWLQTSIAFGQSKSGPAKTSSKKLTKSSTKTSPKVSEDTSVKNPAEVSSKKNEKTPSLSQQGTAFFKALIDSAILSSKTTVKKTIYGQMILTQEEIIVYGSDDRPLVNPNLSAADKTILANSSLSDKNKVTNTNVKIDSIEIQIKKNKIYSIRVWKKGVKFSQLTKTIDPFSIPDSDRIIVTINKVAGYIKVTDLLSFDWTPPLPEDNIQSGVFILSNIKDKEPSSVAITSY